MYQAKDNPVDSVAVMVPSQCRGFPIAVAGSKSAECQPNSIAAGVR